MTGQIAGLMRQAHYNKLKRETEKNEDNAFFS